MKSMNLSVRISGSILGDELRIMIKKLEQGTAMSEAMQNTKFFDIEYKNYIKIGEETGNLGFIFSHITNIYFIRVREKTKRFLKILEPLSIICIAAFIGIVVLSILLPIFKLSENINI